MALDNSLPGLVNFQWTVMPVSLPALGGQGPAEPKAGSVTYAVWTNVGWLVILVTKSAEALTWSLLIPLGTLGVANWALA